MKKSICFIMAMTLLAVLLTGCGNTASQPSSAPSGSSDAAAPSGEKIEVKIAHAGSEETLMNKAWEVAAKYMEENGNFKCAIYPNGSLGSDVELQQAVQNGDIQMSACSTSNLTTFNKDLEVFSLPFAFADEKVAYAVLDGDFGRKMLDSMESSGFKALGYFESNSYRELSSNKVVHSPADLKGMKIRVMQSNLHVAIWQALGASPTPIAFSELYPALQQGTVDAQDNPLELLISQKFYEVQKCVTLTNHIFQVGMATCNLDWFNGLSAEDQEVVQKAIQAGVEYQRTQAAEQKDGYIKTLKDEGIEVIELTDDERAEFKSLMGNAEQIIVTDVGQDLVDGLNTAIKAAG